MGQIQASARWRKGDVRGIGQCCRKGKTSLAGLKGQEARGNGPLLRNRRSRCWQSRLRWQEIEYLKQDRGRSVATEGSRTRGAFGPAHPDRNGVAFREANRESVSKAIG